MERNIKIYSTPYELAEKFAGEIAGLISERKDEDHPFSIALAGGSTPELLYSVLGDHFTNEVAWHRLHLYWGDERCVPPDDHDSNYGMVYRSLIRKIRIPPSNIHRVIGENDPQHEAKRYGREIARDLKSNNGLPVFDLVILGLGEDGHTASIFPKSARLLESPEICEVSVHPVSGQKRITLTGPVIRNADRIVFIATGTSKAEIVARILHNDKESKNFPAALIVPMGGEMKWLLDGRSAALL